MKKLLLILSLFLLVNVVNVYGACTQSGVTGNYSVGEAVTATITCTAVDKGDTGFYVWHNSTNSDDAMENDTYTCPDNSPYQTFVSWTVTANQSPQVNLSGDLYESDVYISDARFNTTVTGGANTLDIISVEITSTVYEGKSAGVKGIVQSQGKVVGYADVCVDILDENDEPYQHIGCKKTEMDGEFLFSGTCDGDSWCFAGSSYKIDIDASCPKNSSSYISCVDEDGDALDWATGSTTSSFIVTDVGDKMIVKANLTEDQEWGIYLEDENGYRVNMTESLATIWQENIDWDIYAQANGQSFLTAGEKFRMCMTVNNTFEDDMHIMVDHLKLIRKPGSHVFPLQRDGNLIGEDHIMHIEVRTWETDNAAYVKCSDWLLVPDNIKGQNNWKVAFHMEVEGYDQEIEANSNRFTIFGERTDTDYVDYLTINNVTFTRDNATEGEYVQFQLNITSNHPIKTTNTRSVYRLFSNWDLATASATPLDAEPYDSLIWTDQDTPHFESTGTFPADYTSLGQGVRFKVPYGLKDDSVYDVIAGSYELFFGDDYQYNLKWNTLQNPTIDITDYDYEITNITTTVSNTEATACDTVTITVTYDNPVSHTNATTEEDELFIMKGWFEDTSNDIYIDDIDVIIQPDIGINDTWTFTTTLPYIGAAGKVEAELDVRIYTFDEDNTDPDCTNCGELVNTFSGDEGDATFNITALNTDDCKYKKQSIVWEDDELYLMYRQTNATESIASKTGTFHFDVDCASEAVDSVSCTITGYVESGEFQKEVDFDCYIDDGVSATNWNSMVGTTPYTTTKTFDTRSLSFAQHTVTCKANYYEFGSSTDTFSDSFNHVSSIGQQGAAAIASSKAKDEIKKITSLLKTNPLLALVTLLLLALFFVPDDGIKKKKKLYVYKRREDEGK